MKAWIRIMNLSILPVLTLTLTLSLLLGCGQRGESDLVSRLNSTDAGGATQVPGKSKLNFHFEIRSDVVVDGEGELDILNQHIGVSVSNHHETLERVLNKVRIPARDVKYIFELSMKFTSLPYLMSDSVKEKLHLRADEKIATTRSQMVGPIISQVNAALMADPVYPTLPQAAQVQIKEQAVANAMDLLDQQLAQAEAEAKEKIDTRVDALQTETMVQEFAVVFGRPVSISDGNDGLLFVKVGKFKIESGPQVADGGNRSRLESFRPVNSRTQRGGAVAPTGAIGAGLVKVFKRPGRNNWTLRTDLYLFHDREAFISGQDYIGTVVSLEDNLYERHKELSNLNSVLLRALISNKNFEFYASVGNYDSDAAFSAGLIVNLTDRTSVMFDFYTGNRQQLKQGYSVFVSHILNPAVTLYAGYEQLKQSYQPTVSNDPQDLGMEVVGVALNPASYLRRLMPFLSTSSPNDNRNWKLLVKLELQRQHPKGNFGDGELVEYGGLQLRGTHDWF